MPTSQETISKVKDILRRMDQSIDSARSRRLAGRNSPQAPSPPPSALNHQASGQPATGAPAGTTNGSPPLRAKPLPRVQNFTHPAFP